MMHQTATATAPARRLSRRTSPRVEILGLLHGYIVSLNLSLLVRDLGAGGFSVESPIAFPRGAVHEFRLTTPDGELIHVRARSTYCREGGDQSTLPYIVGFAFKHDGEDRRSVERLMDAATNVLEFP